MSKTVLATFPNLNHKDGQWGIEVEAEMNDHAIYSMDGWQTKSDGSLQNIGVEFISDGPFKTEDLKSRMDDLRKNMEHIGFTPSIRAGIHIHMNMQQYTIKEVVKTLAVYYMLETALVRQCGPNRSGNLFCLRLRDAPALLMTMENAFTKRYQHLSSDGFRYSSLNITPLRKFGTLEFRALATTPGLYEVEQWCSVLDTIRKYAVSLDSCFDVIEQISGDGAAAWAEKVLGPKLFSHFNHPRLEQDMYADMRNVQHFLHNMKMKEF